MLLTLLLQAPGGGGMTQFLLLGAMFVVLYFFMIRPQQKRAKEAKILRDSLTKGANIVTIGGLHGKIVDVAENSVVVEVDKGTRLTFDRTAIARQL
ncbi:preprotein translocase subunit YajC [Hymenobacter sp. BT507]|uniref:Sec translocon accessory complex subunit YajC n=1 Tax=Hymenobacter citatus TaxID=2763506 RepID=A0ABR7MMQ5_9BACT|nr:preprotein translocase subunit YajC [Hymenobacter citatus]MBC6612362.1 preprotein translocase subunit YajC [Hymenobacter citatus]